MHRQGTLFLCATPIGNLEDITFRLVKVLQDVDLVAAEDTGRTVKLLNHLRIAKKLVSYHEHNKEKTGAELLELLSTGKNIALLSDAGYPCIADPGEQLVKAAIGRNVNVVPIPGANAALCALTASGLATVPCLFGGFLPRTKKHRREKLRMWRDLTCTFVFYEAPHRLLTVLREVREIWGERDIVLARELTKLYEEFFRGDISAGITWLENKPPRGEFTIVLSGAPEQTQCLPATEPLERLNQLLAEGQDKKNSFKQVAQEYNLTKRAIYQIFVESRRDREDS